jgi:hypothetical protein
MNGTWFSESLSINQNTLIGLLYEKKISIVQSLASLVLFVIATCVILTFSQLFYMIYIEVRAMKDVLLDIISVSSVNALPLLTNFYTVKDGLKVARGVFGYSEYKVELESNRKCNLEYFIATLWS